MARSGRPLARRFAQLVPLHPGERRPPLAQAEEFGRKAEQHLVMGCANAGDVNLHIAHEPLDECATQLARGLATVSQHIRTRIEPCAMSRRWTLALLIFSLILSGRCDS